MKKLTHLFNNAYQGKKVLITGNTGFKGAWLTTWLLDLGAEVVGISKDVPTTPSMFEEIRLSERIVHYQEDIRNLEGLKEIFHKEQPDFVFHLAAQAIVSLSYENPVETVTSNVIGTTHILETLRGHEKACVAVIITSDKAYDNVEWEWGYRENDRLGGKDVYSGSKGAAELIIRSYFHSFFQESRHRLGIGRAGNVIGGGDWARDRIVVDCMRAWSKGKVVEIRSPGATRPWQHVLEPVCGYLVLGQALAERRELHGQAFNFGPKAEQSRTVVELLSDLSKIWAFTDPDDAYKITGNIPFHEAGLLKLNCDKALFHLRWEATLFYEETIRFVGEWYYNFYREQRDLFEFSLKQIREYESLAEERQRTWALS